MGTLTTVPVEEYLRTYYEPDMEYVNGQLVERHVGEYFHSLMQLALGAVLKERARERRYRVFAEQRVRVNDEPRYRIPDLCVKALPHERTSVLVQPDLVIEIVSPDDTPTDMLIKIADYTGAGIPDIWIVDPYKHSLFEVGSGGLRRPVSQMLETSLVGAVDFGALFAEIDEPAE
jgi:Uma2 family endonuclease